MKGKTWGPSTLHQRERGAIISQPTSQASPGCKRWSRSAPDLEKTPLRTALLANAHRSPLLQEIGNPSSRKLYSSANNLIDAPQTSDDENPAKKTKHRERSKSKESGKRRDSSESRLTTLADFFRSPAGSRKGSLQGPTKSSSVRADSNLEPRGRQRKSRCSKSPLRALCKIAPWSSKDELDDAIVPAAVPPSELAIPVITTPRFLIANSREGIDFENLEAEFGEVYTLDADHSSDSAKSRSVSLDGSLEFNGCDETDATELDDGLSNGLSASQETVAHNLHERYLNLLTKRDD